MNKPKIVVVIPTVRPEQYKSFISTWEKIFTKHSIKLLTVWDGETPYVDTYDYSTNKPIEVCSQTLYSTHEGLIYRYTDACRNLGFIAAAKLNPDYVLTLDDDVAPLGYGDPIQQHLDVLQKRVPLSWMNTAHNTDLYLRGVPYNIRNSPVMLSHGVWVGTPDFDGETQLKLEQPDGGDYIKPDGTRSNTKGVPYSLPYYVGPIPKGVLFPLCGMSVMVKREALPYLYYAPMGKDTGIVDKENKPILNRFADIWMGISLKKKFDVLNWACYTGGSTVLHTRASDAKKNFEQEKLGREWNEIVGNKSTWMTQYDDQLDRYCWVWKEKEWKFNRLITSLLGSS